MTVSYIAYDLQDGYIHHWLAAGPQAILVKNLEKYRGENFKQKIAQQYHMPKSGITQMPVERGPLTEGVFKVGEYEGSWTYARCADDHCLDHSTSFATCHYLRSWAYTQLVSDTAQTARLALLAVGPVDVWVNKQHVFRRDEFSEQPQQDFVEVELLQGENALLVRFEAVAAPETAMVLAVQLSASGAVQTRIPTLIPSLSRRNELEQVYESLYLDRDVYAQEDLINLRWPLQAEKPAYNDVHFKDASGLIRGQAEDVGKPNDTLFLGHPVSLTEGVCRAVVMPRAWEYYESQIRITKEVTAYVAGRVRFSHYPYGTPEERRSEALGYAARFEDNLFAEIAKMALGRWDSVESKALAQAIESVNERQAGSDLTLLALLGMVIRFGKNAAFPQWVGQRLKDALLSFPYSKKDAGGDLLDYDREDHQIIRYACEILAGQLHPNPVFGSSGQTGKQRRQEGEKLALDWMQARGRGGFAAWDSPERYANSITALSYLIDMARTEQVWELASVLLDKLLYTLALNSYKGVFGSTRGETDSLAVKGGLLEATSGITRVLWGMGTFNAHINGTVSVALMQKYELPPILAEIATDLPEELWNQEQQSVDDVTVNTVTYRTPDGMLCSAQDYRSGKAGAREHIWQATFGPKSVVFTNHPANSSDAEERGPNFWRGNGVLPRVAQWKDTLIALYNLPDDDVLGYTHAYFPVIEFDEYVLRDGWAFARKGEGYVVLKASVPVTFVEQGQTGNRELRAYGKQVAWVCQLGRAVLDGDFSTFQEKVLATALTIDGLMVQYHTLRGEMLTLGWEGPFLRDGADSPLNGYKHFQNAYCEAELPCMQMEVKTEHYVLRLDFSDLTERS